MAADQQDALLLTRPCGAGGMHLGRPSARPELVRERAIVKRALGVADLLARNPNSFKNGACQQAHIRSRNDARNFCRAR